MATIEDADKALDLVWKDIFELVDAVKNGKSESEISDAKEHISWSLIELGNLAYLRGQESKMDKEKQLMSEVDTTCNCSELDDDLIQDGWTCYNCYEHRKDNPGESD